MIFIKEKRADVCLALMSSPIIHNDYFVHVEDEQTSDAPPLHNILNKSQPRNMRIGVKLLLSCCIEEVLYHMEECVPLGRGASGDRGSKVLMPCELQKLNFGAPFVENQNKTKFSPRLL